MEGNITGYYASIASGLPPELLSDRTSLELHKLVQFFKNFSSSEYILETHLNSPEQEVDFSFRVLREEMGCFRDAIKHSGFSGVAEDLIWQRIIDFAHYWWGNELARQSLPDIWFELDAGEHGKAVPQPCFFFNATEIKKGSNVDYALLFQAMEKLLGKEQVELLRSNTIRIIQYLPHKTGLFQIGTMLARNTDRVRIFTLELTQEQAVEYLHQIAWRGSFTELKRIFQLVQEYSDGQYILDFDITSQGVAEKLGINFGLKNSKVLPGFLDNLVRHELCNDAKKRAVLAWKGNSCSFLGKAYGQTAMIKNISHFKIISQATGLASKAYLRVAGIYLKDLFKANKSY